MRASTKLRQLLKEPGIIVAPGCYDALTAKLIQHVGFKAAYMSGGSASAAYLGMPDVGLITMTEMTTVAHHIALAVDIPVFGDMDTGFGSPVYVRRAMREFEATGLAGVHIEDQITEKHCGHMAGKVLVSADEMVQKIRAAVDVRHDPDFVLIARTDAIAVEGVPGAIQRARRYAEAGADVLYMEAPRSVEEIRAVASGVPAPVLIGQPENGVTPVLPPQQLEEWGVKIVTYPRSIRLMAIKGALDVLKEIREEGVTTGLADRMVHDEVLQKIIGTPEIADLADRYSV
ncbi:MAG: oxaloacetate decarboxylase [candidate division NC10 bacterium]|nr:oxaloacetate decarboxylase [candidate division NC10 bacterium]